MKKFVFFIYSNSRVFEAEVFTNDEKKAEIILKQKLKSTFEIDLEQFTIVIIGVVEDIEDKVFFTKNETY